MTILSVANIHRIAIAITSIAGLLLSLSSNAVAFCIHASGKSKQSIESFESNYSYNPPKPGRPMKPREVKIVDAPQITDLCINGSTVTGFGNEQPAVINAGDTTYSNVVEGYNTDYFFGARHDGSILKVRFGFRMHSGPGGKYGVITNNTYTIGIF